MKVSELEGATLDYWTARAEGVPADELEIRATGTLCVRNLRGTPGNITAVCVLNYSTNWALAGPLLLKTGGVDERCRNGDLHDIYWQAPPGYDETDPSTGDTPLIAICRAVVRAAFGDEVGDLPC